MMSGTTFPGLEELLQEKIALYSRLRDCFIKERECLIGMKLDQLWTLSDEKHELCSKIESLRKEILTRLELSPERESLDLHQILDALPWEQKEGFRNLHFRLIGVKAEIENLRRENKSSVEDSLRFLDEMLSVLTGEALPQSMYDRKFQVRQTGNRLRLSREV